MPSLISRFTRFIYLRKGEILPFLIIIFASFLVWKHIPSLQFEGEGYYYFTRIFEYKNVSMLLHDTTTPLTYDTFAIFIFNIITPYFKDQVHLYMWFLLIFMIAIDAAFYITARLVTGNKLTGFLAALIFSTNFAGKFDMYSNGGYQYFLQRATSLLPLLLALSFLVLYLKKSKFGYYVISFFLYILGVVMGFFATFFLPAFVFVPLAFIKFKTRKFWNRFLRIIWIPIPFVLGNFLIIHKDSYASPGDSIIELLFNKTSFIFNGLLQQLAVITLPIGWYADLSKFIGKPIYYTPEAQNNFFVMNIIIIAVYIAATTVIWKLHPKLVGLAITSLLSTMGILFFNLYLNSHESLSTVSSTRYFYYPSATLALYWGIFWSSLFLQNKLRFKLALIVFCAIWITHNILGIQNGLKDNEWRNKTNKAAISYLRFWSSQLKKEPSYVYLPRTLGPYGQFFVFKYFSHHDGTFVMEGFGNLDIKGLSQKNFDPERLFVLEINKLTNELVDTSIEHRIQLKKLRGE